MSDLSNSSKTIIPPLFYDENEWFERFKQDFIFDSDQVEKSNPNDFLMKIKKPVPMKWSRFYVENIRFESEEEAKQDSFKWVDESIKIMGGSEGLTTLQEFVLDGDIETAMYQVKKTLEMIEDEDEGLNK